MAIRKKEHENLSDSNIKKVIELLEAEKPISKKEAYAILNIAPNSNRLNKIIEEFKEQQALSIKRRAEKRGKPATDGEIQHVIQEFLDGVSVKEIADSLYRPSSFVKDLVERVGIPQRDSQSSYWVPSLVPEPCMRDEFEVGQLVWSTKRQSMAIVRSEEENRSDKTSNYYKLWIIETIEEPSPYFPQYQNYGGYYDGAYAYDLCSLEHLKKYGVDVYRPYRAHFTNWLK